VKVYLDDERVTPEGWTRVFTAQECIALLETGQVTELSLDHDLGPTHAGTGYDVVVWMEEAVFTRGFIPPRRTKVHSQNPVGKQKMKHGLQNVYRKLHDRTDC
jgi:hypothetical protein